MKPSQSDTSKRNIDAATVESFGQEWSKFDQARLNREEINKAFDAYFSIFPWQTLPPDSEGFDMGCGSGRWAALVAPRVGRLNCVDPSKHALEVARKNLAAHANVRLISGGVEDDVLPLASQDFGYSLGVLHHVPDTSGAIRSCANLLKPGAPFLIYLYYRFDNRPVWYRGLWRATDYVRLAVSRQPEWLKVRVTDALALGVYWPVARFSLIMEWIGLKVHWLPLSFYRDKSLYTMRTDSRDRFGTPLERRFTRAEIAQMLLDAGFTDVQFSNHEPYWVALARKS